MKRISFLLVLVSLFTLPARAQSSATPPPGVRLTVNVFRAPVTGIEIRRGHMAGYAGFYSTVIPQDGRNRTVSFARFGATYFLTPEGSSFYASPGVGISLTDGWQNSYLMETGYRRRVTDRLEARAGAVLLANWRLAEVRLNPAIGLGWAF